LVSQNDWKVCSNYVYSELDLTASARLNSKVKFSGHFFLEKCSQQLGARKRPLSIVVRASCHDVNLIYFYLNYVNQIAKLFIQFISIFLTQEMSNFKCWRSPSNCAIYFMDLGNGHSLYFVVLGETRMKTNDLFIFLNSRLFVNSY